MNGLYDGFEGYRLSAAEDVARALVDALIVLDANALLNLYRYNESTRDDLFRVLESIGDRLVVPHQALREFWRNRIAAIGNPASAAQEARQAFAKNRRSTIDALDRWAKSVALEEQRHDELKNQTEEFYNNFLEVVEGGQPSRVNVGTPAKDDPILVRLETLLSGKVTQPLDDNEWETCVAEGKRRVEAKTPPGYLDEDKGNSDLPEGASGDYLVWYQACQATRDRNLDLLIVTGDEKEDWWWRHQSEFLGPRPELSTELLQLCGRRLFMLRPRDLLAQSSALKVSVREESLADAERARPESYENQGWTKEAVFELLSRLDAEGLVQGDVIRAAAQLGGEIDRETVYEIAGYGNERMLRGFTRPTARITADLQAEGFVASGVQAMLVALYPEGVKASGFRIPAEVVRILRTVGAQSGD